MSFLLNKRIILITGTFVLVFSFLVNPLLLLAQTQFNQQINYQGKLTNSAGVAVPNGTYNMKFWLIASSTAATSSAVWSETRTGGDRVQVTNGLFSVMLGEVSSLSSVDFNKTLYLGVEIGATNTTPVWDGEMSPRKILGAVPAAFEAKNAQTLGGIATTSFLRSDQIDTMEATSSSALLTLIQNGTGKILSLFSGVTEMFTILSNGNVGIASSTPSSKLTVIGNSYLNGSLQLTGALKDSTNATGTLGMILKTTGTSTQWIATSSLGLGNGTFLGLTDTPSSFTANRIMFTNSGATALTDSANLTFDGTNLGLGSQNGLAFGSIRYLYASSTNDSLVFGENAGSTFNSGTAYNTAMGFEAGRYASSTFTNYSNLIGYQAGYNNDGSFNNIIGSGSGYNNTGWYNNIIGSDAGFNNAGDDNNLIGDEAGYQNSGSDNEMIGFGAGRNLQSTSSVVIGGEAYRGGAGSTAFQAVNNVAIGYRAGYSAQTGASNNILVGYKAADNITTGSNNIVIGYDVDIASTTRSNQLNIGNLIFGTGLNGTGTALSSGNIGIGTTTPGSKLTVIGGVDITNSATSSSAITLRDTIGNVSLEFKAGTSTLENTLIGLSAGRVISTGSNNAALGAGTLYYNTTGSNNTALGWQSLFQNATGSNNTASGFRALYANVGSNNTAYGYGTLRFNTTGTENTASGLSSLNSNTIGNYNTAYGSYSLNKNTIGNANISIGSYALDKNTTGNYNTAIGYYSLQANIAGEFNTALGRNAGFDIDTATGTGANTLIGYNTGRGIVTGVNNTILGANVTGLSSTLSNNIIIADGAGNRRINVDSSGNVGIGTTTPGSKLTVVGDVDIINTANDSAAITLRDTIGNVSLEIKAGTSTLENILIGVASGQFITTGSNNAALGAGTLYYNTTGSNNTALGWQSLFQNATGSNNTASGFRALYANVGSDNTAYGTYALAGNTTGTENTASGLSSLISNTIGSYNTAYGTYALAGNTTGNSNTAMGYASLQANIAGDFNTALGLNAGFDIDTATGTGANTLIGYNTGRGIVTGVNNTILGANVTGLSSTLSNNIIIADGAGNRRINVDSSGNVGIGTTTPVSLLAMGKITFTGAGIAGINQYLKSTNSTASAVQYGNFGYLYASNTATTTITGNMFKIEDNTTFGNTTRGFEVQTDIGTNTLGENTALSGFARTFGVRGTTKGNAGITYEPAGIFGETQGTTQGNAIRGYSSTITSASLLKLFQDSSTFTGTGLLMNFGNSGGSFSSTTASKFIDLKNAGTSMFTVGAYGALVIGDGTTGHNAGIQVGYGGICVDNDGTCNASTTGRVSAVSYHTGNSDLAETYFSNENLKVGEVVYIKGGLSVGRATEINKDKIIGVVSTKPGLLLGFDDTSLNKREKSYPIALKGRVPVRLSNENGDIKVGDELMLSSLAGVVMKATSTGMIVGVALEDFNGDRAYSDTYINQFGDDLVDPVFEPINKDNDPRINDGCYFGGGRASGEEVCIPLVSTTTDGRIAEAEALARRDAEEKALAKLANISGERINLDNGREVEVGQIVMFVDLRNRTLDEAGVEIINSLMSKASSSDEFETETIWQRLVQLANNFIGGVLSVFTLEADRVEVKDQLCVDGVCVTGEDLRELLKKENESSQIINTINNGVNNSEEVRIDEVENNISNLNNENQLPLDIQNTKEVISISEEILSETEEKVYNDNLKTEVDSPIIIIDNKETPTGVNIVGEVNIENIENVVGS